MTDNTESREKKLQTLDNEHQVKSALLKRALQYICLPANKRLLKERAAIIKEGQSFFNIIDEDPI